MNNNWTKTMGLMMAVVCSTSALVIAGTPVEMITYQGLLKDAGANVDGPVNLEFRLFDDEVAGNQVGSTVLATETATDGLFSAQLDFGLSPYTGTDPLYIEVTVEGQALSRQLMTSAPYSMATRGIDVDESGNVGIGTDSPQAPLDVLGQLRFDQIGNSRGMYHNVAGNHFQFTSNNTTEMAGAAFLRMKVNGVDKGKVSADQFEITNDLICNQSVGIGTATPATTLDVVGTATATAFVGDGSGLTNLPSSSVWDENGSDISYEDGNVGIGTATPATELDVIGTVTATELALDGGATSRITVAGTTMELQSADHGLKLFDFDGDLVGTFFSEDSAGAQVRFDTTTPGYWSIGPNSDNTFQIGNGPGQPTKVLNMIPAGGGDLGSVGINTASPSEALHVVGNICATGTIGSCSDMRFKKNINGLSGALDKVDRLRGVHFDWKRDEYPTHGFGADRELGFIAQEVETVYPEAVSQGSDGYYTVDYGRLTPVLVEAIKELRAQKNADNEELKNVVRAQQKVIDAQNDRLARIERLMKASGN
jgi:hypothetical protein